MGGGYGFYGKIPAAGDFVRRSLSPDFVRGWDEWLQRMLLSGRDALGERWQECYFSAPIWRFSLSPGLCGPLGAVGVVMPSVDRVGRQFPLCIAAEVETEAWPSYLAVEDMFAGLENAALSSLEDDTTLDALDAALSAISPPRQADRARPEPVGQAISYIVERPVDAALGNSTARSVWISSIDGQNRVLTATGMLEGQAEAAALFDLSASVWTRPAAQGVC